MLAFFLPAMCARKTDTTRAPRPGEENGKAYHFVTVPQFEDLIKQVGHTLSSSILYEANIADMGSICRFA